jgi:hypothetical protein
VGWVSLTCVTFYLNEITHSSLALFENNDIKHHREDILLINSSDDFLHHIQVVNQF